MSSTVKILVSGDVDGRFQTLFSRVANVNKKSGPFEMLLCVGNFFGTNNETWDKYLSGEQEVPVPTYVLGPNKMEHVAMYPELSGCELCNDVMYLGRRGVFTTASGVKIAYLSGVEREHGPANFRLEDLKFVMDSLHSDFTFKGVDILLTSEWPKGVFKYAGKPDGTTSDGSAFISGLAVKTKPRYHFCGLEGIYYERLPYRNHQVLNESSQHVTRFIGLAKAGNPEKKKWLYAFGLSPMKKVDYSSLTSQPPDVTECPYGMDTTGFESQLKLQDDKGAQFFYDMDSAYTSSDIKKRRHHDADSESSKKKRPPPKQMGPCWFCLASPEVEKHLVISIGDQAYLSLAKGGLVPSHLLILPIGHYQSTVELPEDVHEEIEKFKVALRKHFKKKKMAMVLFERNYKSSHLQIQVVPVPEEIGPSLKCIFQDYADSEEINLDEIPQHSELQQIVQPGTPYFYVELPSEEKLYYRVRKNFPLQFGREVLASPPVLDMPERADWRECKSTKDEEIKMASEFRKEFEPHDFTI